MKKVLIFNGSPRRSGNTSAMVNSFTEGAKNNTSRIESHYVDELNLNYCTGCLRCNMIGRCGQRGDDWENIAAKIDQADILVFASPVYFHHVTAQLKKLLDRFRSFVHVQITESGIVHTPVKMWNKEIVCLLSMGSSDPDEAKPIEDLFTFILSYMSPGKKVHSIKATRLAVSNQILKTSEELEQLYKGLKIPSELALVDARTNQITLKNCLQLAKKLTE
ncbi:MAG: hypothetical protein C0594_17100 [Marinilabiliales bacterium]|nr:MAG: hypothetical protein C0594_17100 [Marinilabiliales bacterium]